MEEMIPFEQIVNETKRLVLAAVARFLNPNYVHAIDDVVQETYLRAYRHLSTNRFRGDAKISSWLYTIARNESLRMNKKLKREEEKIQNTIYAESQKSAADDSRDSLIDKDDLDEVMQLLDSLPEKFSSVLRLVIAGKSIAEIASHLHISQGTVKSRTFRAKGLMRNHYQKNLQQQILGGEQ